MKRRRDVKLKESLKNSNVKELKPKKNYIKKERKL
jgi:hypothetical protein